MAAQQWAAVERSIPDAVAQVTNGDRCIPAEREVGVPTANRIQLANELMVQHDDFHLQIRP